MLCEDLFFGSPIVGSVIKVHVLVVDDDSTCLNLISGLLKVFNYQVSLANNTDNAIAMLRMNEGFFDLVLSNVYMPFMNGVELKKKVEQDFQIPCILMSADDKEGVIQQVGMDPNAHYIMKPPSILELKNLWCHVISNRNSKNKSKKTSESGETSHKRKSSSDRMDDDGEDKGNNSKKTKMIWTNALHYKFLEAIKEIGYDKAVPKNILEYMNVPTLTRQHISSHLQKYRIFLRQLSDTRISEESGIPENWNQRPFRSGFTWSQFPALANNSILLRYTNPFNLIRNHEATVSTPNIYGTTQPRVNNHMMMRPVANDKTPYFGASSPLGLSNILPNPTYGRPLHRSSILRPLSNDVIARLSAQSNANDVPPMDELHILESSMVGSPNVDKKGDNNGGLAIGRDQVSDRSQQVTTARGGELDGLSGNLGSDMGRASNGTIVAPYGDVGIKFDNNNDLIYTDGALENFLNANTVMMENPVDEDHFVEHQQPIVNTNNVVEQPPTVNMSLNFVEQPPNVVTNMSNFMNRASTFSVMANMMCNDNVTRFEPAITANMSNFLEQQPSSTFQMCNFVEQPQRRAGVGNMPNYMVPQQSQPGGATRNIMSEFMEPQPNLGASPITNMSNLHNLHTNYHHVVTPNRNMDNPSITSTHEVMSNDVSSIATQPMVARNQLDVFASSNNFHQQGMQGFGNLALSTTYDYYSLEDFEDFT